MKIVAVLDNVVHHPLLGCLRSEGTRGNQHAQRQTLGGNDELEGGDGIDILLGGPGDDLPTGGSQLGQLLLIHDAVATGRSSVARGR